MAIGPIGVAHHPALHLREPGLLQGEFHILHFEIDTEDQRERRIRRLLGHELFAGFLGKHRQGFDRYGVNMGRIIDEIIVPGVWYGDQNLCPIPAHPVELLEDAEIYFGRLSQMLQDMAQDDFLGGIIRPRPGEDLEIGDRLYFDIDRHRDRRFCLSWFVSSWFVFLHA